MQTVAAADPLSLKLGVTLPLSGPLASSGEDVRHGIDFALEKLTDAAVHVSVVYDDNKHEAVAAAASAHRLLDVEHADIVISMWDMADVVAPIAEQKGALHIAIRWDPSVAERYPHTFTFESTYQSYCESELALLKKLRARSVTLLTQQSVGWTLGADYMKQLLPGADIKLLREERFQPGQNDYRAEITRGIQQHPDYLVFFANPPDLDKLIHRAHEIPSEKYTGYFDVLSDYSQVEGMPYVAQGAPAQWFIEEFKKRYGAEPKIRSPEAFDIVRLLLVAAHDTGKIPNPASLGAVLHTGEHSNGASGKLSLRGERTIETENSWKIVRNGKVERYVP